MDNDLTKAIAAKFVDELGALGVNNMITMMSEHTVAVDIRTLTDLIEMAQRLKLVEESDRDSYHTN